MITVSFYGSKCKIFLATYVTSLTFSIHLKQDVNTHSVETPSTVDPQWNILYWGYKWNLHTVCCGTIGREWGTTSIYFGITCVCFILIRLPVFIVEPQYQHREFFICVKSIIWRTHTKSLKKSCWFKIWMGFVGQILIKLWTSSIWGFL